MAGDENNFSHWVPSGKNSSILQLIAVAMRCRLRFSLWFRRVSLRKSPSIRSRKTKYFRSPIRLWNAKAKGRRKYAQNSLLKIKGENSSLFAFVSKCDGTLMSKFTLNSLFKLKRRKLFVFRLCLEGLFGFSTFDRRRNAFANRSKIEKNRLLPANRLRFEKKF